MNTPLKTLLLPLLVATAEPGLAQVSDTAIDEHYSLHAQFTEVVQGHGDFTSPYEGPNSLKSDASIRQTSDLTVYAGLRLGTSSAFYANGEIDQGFGLSNTLGLAGYASGEAYKVGRSQPYAKLQRAFLRHHIDLGGDSEYLDPVANQLGEHVASERLTLTVGKLSVTDLFDTNRYTHDPRADFLNWSLIDAGAFDYAADAWGYSYGAAAEWTLPHWTLRGGSFALSRIPNSPQLDARFRQFALIGELEHRLNWDNRDGALRLTAFANHGHMADYEDAVALSQNSGQPADAAAVRHMAWRPGAAVNFEQQLSETLGAFARLSANDGSKEAFEFTDINRSASAGLSLLGSAWQRQEDTVGFAGVINGLSSAARHYFAAGGTGILIGDGQLPHYGTERIAELYYRLQLSQALQISADCQYVDNPAYNRDRGPVRLAALRVHAQF